MHLLKVGGFKRDENKTNNGQKLSFRTYQNSVSSEDRSRCTKSHSDKNNTLWLVSVFLKNNHNRHGWLQDPATVPLQNIVYDMT